MRIGPDELLKTTHQIKSELRAKFPLSYFETKYKTLKEDYPYLFDMLLENSEHSMEILKKMIISLRLIQDGNRTVEEMDKIIGYELAKEFVYEKLDMTEEEIPEPDPIFNQSDSEEEPDQEAEDY
jgi:hypothetical protein